MSFYIMSPTIKNPTKLYISAFMPVKSLLGFLSVHLGENVFQNLTNSFFCSKRVILDSSFRFLKFFYATSGKHKKSLRHPFCDRMFAGYWLCQSRRGFRCSLLSRLRIGCPFLMVGLLHQVCPYGSV